MDRQYAGWRQVDRLLLWLYQLVCRDEKERQTVERHSLPLLPGEFLEKEPLSRLERL
jgi:hypothetical protein